MRNPPLDNSLTSSTSSTGSPSSVQNGGPDTEVMSDASSIIARLRKREEAALGDFYDRWVQQVYSFTFEMTQNKDLAEDLVEETFWFAWEWIDSYDSIGGSVQVWLIGIARECRGGAGQESEWNGESSISKTPLHMINRGRSAGIRSRLLDRAASRDGKIAVVRRAGALPPRPIPPAKAVQAVGTVHKTEESGVNAAHEDSDSPKAEPDSSVFADQPSLFSETKLSTSVVEPEVFVAPAELTDSSPEEDQIITSHMAHPGIKSEKAGNGVSASRVLVWLTLTVLIAGGAFAAQEWRIRKMEETFQIERASREALNTRRISALETLVAQRDQKITAISGEDVRIVNLTNYSARGQVLARVFWDQSAGEWNLKVYNIRQPKPGHLFQLWAVSSGASTPMSLGVFVPDEEGRAEIRYVQGMEKGVFVRAMISEEPDPGSVTPTGSIVLAGG